MKIMNIKDTRFQNDIYIPIIDLDGIQSIYCKSYCTKCKIWLLNNFKTFNTDQHTASQSHQYFVRNGNLEQNKDNALSILTNSKKF